MDRQKLLVSLLRVAGSVELLAFIAMVMPRAWMETAHTGLGLGEMPGGPIIMFMIRQSSYVYGMHGVAMWILAGNLERFRPLVIFNGVGFLLAAPVYFIIDYVSGMPWWWTLVDALACGLFGAAVLWLCRTSESPTHE